MSMIGKTLGTFECTALLGKGGMGEVYKAKDQKLGRDVAIKVLPEEFAKDVDRVARFQREAKLLASLNHPNIAAIHGLEESDGTHFLVLELIEGDTLADRLNRGAIPVEESLKLALQIAEALEAAHEKGVIHRDLKPANIKITPDGKVKVLDFGLAKAFAGEQAEVNLSHSPTLSEAATLQGVILGTAAYMSPEQARGKPVDKRTDIWAFGCVLYEMLTGKAAFQGEDVTEILAAVVKSGVNLDLLPTNIHPRIREVITRCLQKEQKKRYRDIGEAQYEIEQVLADPSGMFAQPSLITKPRKQLRLGIPWVAAVFFLGLIIAGITVWKLKPADPRHVYRFDYDLPEDQEFTYITKPGIAVSAKGTEIVYVANQQLYLKNSNELTAKPIRGTDENPANPFFSPDGQWIGYFASANMQLKKIAVGGGVPVMLCEVNSFFGATWETDDRIVFGEQSGIMQVSADGSNPEILVKGESAQPFFNPQILPDRKTLLFTVLTENGLQVAVQSLESEARKDLFPGDSARYVSTGHLVYALEDNIYAVPFDPDTLEVKGGQTPLVEGVFRFVPNLLPHLALSDSGLLAYIPGSGLPISDLKLAWVDKEGREKLIEASPVGSIFPRVSPDGRKVAVTIGGPRNSDIWIFDLNRETSRRLTLDTTCSVPFWTPDGKRIVYGNEDDNNVYWRSADGTGEPKLLASIPDGRLYPWSWADDGKTLVLEDYVGDDIGILSMEGDGEWIPLMKEKYDERQPQVSPDGRWIAYISDESGENEVYIRPFPEVESGKEQVSRGGGTSPLWSPDGKELYYHNKEAVMVVAIETGQPLMLESPRLLFEGKYFYDHNVVGPIWDISPDGKYFLMIKPMSEESENPKITIVLNWFEELKERVPVE